MPIQSGSTNRISSYYGLGPGSITPVSTMTMIWDSGPVYHMQLIGRVGTMGDPKGIVAVVGAPVTGSGYVIVTMTASPEPGDITVLVGIVNIGSGVGPPEVLRTETWQLTVAG
jgi:hypothetical protein